MDRPPDDVLGAASVGGLAIELDGITEGGELKMVLCRGVV